MPDIIELQRYVKEVHYNYKSLAPSDFKICFTDTDYIGLLNQVVYPVVSELIRTFVVAEKIHIRDDFEFRDIIYNCHVGVIYTYNADYTDIPSYYIPNKLQTLYIPEYQQMNPVFRGCQLLGDSRRYFPSEMLLLRINTIDTINKGLTRKMWYLLIGAEEIGNPSECFIPRKTKSHYYVGQPHYIPNTYHYPIGSLSYYGFDRNTMIYIERQKIRAESGTLSIPSR